MLELHLKMCLTSLLVPRPTRSAVVRNYWIRVRPSVCLFVNFFFYAATELENYLAESNETFYNERIYIEIVDMGIGFVVRIKFGSYDLVKNEELQHNFGVYYSATELNNYGEESNEPFCNERIYTKVVHLGIGFVVRPKLGSYDLRNETTMKPIPRYLTKMIYSLQAMKRPSNEIVGYVSL